LFPDRPPRDRQRLVEHFKAQLAETAQAADAGYPANTDLVLEGDRPLLKRRKGADRRRSAIALEEAVHDRLSERGLLDIITVSAHRLGWHKHFGPASGSDPKLRDALGRYCLTVFTYGTLLGPAQVARHMEGTVSAHELYTAGNKHTTAEKITRASAEVINALAQLDVASVWGDGRTVAADGTQIDTWEDNLLAESHIRYGGYGGIADRHVSDTYIALFSHFIPCGVWEAVDQDVIDQGPGLPDINPHAAAIAVSRDRAWAFSALRRSSSITRCSPERSPTTSEQSPMRNSSNSSSPTTRTITAAAEGTPCEGTVPAPSHARYRGRISSRADPGRRPGPARCPPRAWAMNGTRHPPATWRPNSFG
jgi:hypothetical protein